MGINIHEDNRVEFDDSHQDRVDTSLARNMSSKHVDGVPYRFIFRRLQSTIGDSSDGNPLIYALKEMKGYRIDATCKQNLMNRAHEIIDKGADSLKADAIIPIPSSYSFCREFSGFLGEVLGIPVVEGDFIGKKTVAQVLDEASSTKPEFPKPYIRGLYKSQLKAWAKLPPNTQVTMKRVDKKIRPYFNHLVLSELPPCLLDSSVLIVDDIMASGTSMRCTVDLLRGQNVRVASGVCFLSGL